ncbi:hypothetical protein GXW82_36735 [Streptacidiphilus sp. 4-A2]|nr:hypothetical protein [Streptacidiphilus sp. 4-A2]
MPQPLSTAAALAAAHILHRHPDLTQGMAVAIATSMAPVAHGQPAHFILTDHPRHTPTESSPWTSTTPASEPAGNTRSP